MKKILFVFLLLCGTVFAEKSMEKGVCIYFIGLSGAGKSTLCNALKERLNEVQNKAVVIVDGDEIRKYLASELGFSKRDRSINVRRIGYVASKIVETGGICLCANIAPYDEDRLVNRELIGGHGTYIEVYVKTPLEICEKRDVKGLYKAARAGKIPQFTGVSDPFEDPTKAEIVLDTEASIDKSIDFIIDELVKLAPQFFS